VSGFKSACFHCEALLPESLTINRFAWNRVVRSKRWAHLTICTFAFTYTQKNANPDFAKDALHSSNVRGSPGLRRVPHRDLLAHVLDPEYSIYHLQAEHGQLRAPERTPQLYTEHPRQQARLTLSVHQCHPVSSMSAMSLRSQSAHPPRSGRPNEGAKRTAISRRMQLRNGHHPASQ